MKDITNQTNILTLDQTILQIIATDMRPPLFEYTGELFWNDPHISKQMLKAHLNPDHDAASRNLQAIIETVDHLFWKRYT